MLLSDQEFIPEIGCKGAKAIKRLSRVREKNIMGKCKGLKTNRI